MIARYTRPEMGRIWSDENKFRTWLEVEIAATETLAEAGLVPQSAAKAIREKGDFDLDRINEIEAEVKHDVIAFTTAVAEKVGPESRWLHYGLTSNDVVDTAQALLVKQASAIIRDDLEKLSDVLKRRAFEFKDTPQIGRTHGVHAEPITFGLKLANWYSEMLRNIERFELAAEQMRVGKLSGAVGNAAHLDPEYEEKICERLGLNVAAVSSQVIQRDRHAFYVATLAVIASTLDKIATEDSPPAAHRSPRSRRVLQREAEGLVGHAAQAQSRNLRADQRTGARRARQRAGRAGKRRAVARARHLALVGRARHPARLDHPRRLPAQQDDQPDRQLMVYPQRMMRNLESTGGLVFSGQLLLDLVEAGVLREDAYRLVQRTP